MLINMDDDQFDDLKQFIDGRVSQSELRLANKDDLKKLEKKVEDGFRGIGETVDNLINHFKPRIDDHEKRISLLEQSAKAG